MEPITAVAQLSKEGKLDLWMGVQSPLVAAAQAAEAIGIPEEDATLHNLSFGGSFGRRTPSCYDFVIQVAQLANSTWP